MTIGPRSQCIGSCVHYRSPFSRTDGNFSGRPFCAAFLDTEDGIPDAVLENEIDHRQPIDGDKGVRWQSNGAPFPTYAFAPDRLGVGSKRPTT